MAHSVKSTEWQQQPCFLFMYSLENIITSKYSLHKLTFLANYLDLFYFGALILCQFRVLLPYILSYILIEVSLIDKRP